MLVDSGFVEQQLQGGHIGIVKLINFLNIILYICYKISYRIEHSVKRCPSKGRPVSLNHQQEKEIIAKVRANPFVSAPLIKEDLGLEVNFEYEFYFL